MEVLSSQWAAKELQVDPLEGGAVAVESLCYRSRS